MVATTSNHPAFNHLSALASNYSNIQSSSHLTIQSNQHLTIQTSKSNNQKLQPSNHVTYQILDHPLIRPTSYNKTFNYLSRLLTIQPSDQKKTHRPCTRCYSCANVNCIQGLFKYFRHFTLCRKVHICDAITQEAKLEQNTIHTAKTRYRNSKQVFPEKEFRGLIPNFNIHKSVSYLYVSTIGLPILLQENMWTDPGNI